MDLREAFMKRVILSCATLVSMAFALAAAGVGAERPKFAVLLKTLANPHWVAMKQGLDEAFKKYNVDGVIQAMPSEADVGPQLTTCLAMLQAKPDALLVGAINSVNLNPCLKEASKRGIVIADLDFNLTPEIMKKEKINVTFTLSADNFFVGGLGARYIVNKLGADAKGTILVLEGLAGNQTGLARAEGFKDSLGKLAPGLKIIASLPGDWDRLKSANITNDVLTRDPNLSAIYAANDTMALGAVETVYAAGKGGKIVVVGTDGNSDAIKSIRAGRLHATVAQFPYLVGVQSVELALKALKGQKVDRFSKVTPAIIDKPMLDEGTDPQIGYLR